MNYFKAVSISTKDGSDLIFDPRRLSTSFAFLASFGRGDLAHDFLDIRLGANTIEFISHEDKTQIGLITLSEDVDGWDNYLMAVHAQTADMNDAQTKGYLSNSFMASDSAEWRIKNRVVAERLATAVDDRIGISIGNGPRDMGSHSIYGQLIRLVLPMALAERVWQVGTGVSGPYTQP